jgi:hypothetical protein
VNENEWTPLTNDTVFVSDKCAGYRIELNNNKNSIEFKGRGPMVAIHVSGDGFIFSQPATTPEKRISNNGYTVVRPDLETTLRVEKGRQSTLILFEVR